MKMGTKNPEQRKVNIRWSARRWAPQIVFRPANGRCASVGPEFELDGVKPLSGRQTTLLWRRDETRPSWR